MPGAFAAADLVVCRAGAGAVSELAAARKPSVLIPFPFAADQHQLKNAQAFERAGAARMSLDREWNGERLFQTVRDLYEDRARLKAMGDSAGKFAHPGAARRAAELLVQAGMKID
jgi:UDP-N-acetylglucosamine--N-acetylmuramyl-(pentapeptide) pyrophosphoryl-undecaprenol N-acetylglucosamine transferase